MNKKHFREKVGLDKSTHYKFFRSEYKERKAKSKNNLVKKSD